MNADFELIGSLRDTVLLLRPITGAAHEWVHEHIDENASYLGDAVAIEHRYVADILQGIQSEGLTITREK